MKNIFEKLISKVLPFVLCICIVSGAAAPAYAAPTTIDQWAQYDGSGWSYNSSSGTFSWNTNMANSSEFVILSYLRDLYSSVKTYNDNLKSGWLYTSNGYTYPSGWSGSFYKVVLDMINNVNTSVNNNFHSNLQSYSPYPLYSYKNFIDSNLNNSQSFSSQNFILNFISGISALNTNISYIANQFYADNTSGSYNARSLLNQALHKYVDSSSADYTTILNSIKSNTDNLSGIKTDTANLSGIKTDTANLSGIKTDTANLSGIKTDLETFNNDYNNINWVNSSYTNYYFTREDISTPVSPAFGTVSGYFIFNTNYNNGLYKIKIPVSSNSPQEGELIYKVGYINRNKFVEIPDAVICISSDNLYSDFIIDIPFQYSINNAYPIALYFSNKEEYGMFYVRSYEPYIYTLNSDTNDYYNVSNKLYDSNILRLFKQAKEIFFDDKTIAAKRANQSNEDSVLTNFTGSGAASATPSDFGAVKDSMVSFKSGFSGGASSSDTFSFMSGDSNAWDWFTQETANDLDRTQGNNTRLLRGSPDVAYDTPLLDSYYTSILSILGGDN